MKHRGYTAVANVEVKHFVTHAHHNAATSASAAASHNGCDDRVQPSGSVGHEDELVGRRANPFRHDALRLDHVRKQLAIDKLEWLPLCMRPPRRGDCDTEAAGRSKGAVIEERPARVEPKVRIAQRMAEDGHRRSRRLGGDDLRHGGGQGWRRPFAGSGCGDHLLDGGAVEARARQRRVGGRRARRRCQPPRRRRAAAPKPSHWGVILFVHTHVSLQVTSSVAQNGAHVWYTLLVQHGYRSCVSDCGKLVMSTLH